MKKHERVRSSRVRRVAIRSLNRRLSVNDRWLLSFGDMLTLVLCFFVCLLVTVDDASNKTKLKTIGDTPSRKQAQSEEQSVSGEDDGTQFAKFPIHEPEIMFFFGAEGFGQDGYTLSEDASKELKKALNSMDWTEGNFMIGLCNNGQTQISGSQLMTEVSRVLSVRSQLIDTGFKTDGLKLDFQERNCDESHSEVRRIGGTPVLTYLRMLRRLSVNSQGNRSN